MRHIYVSLIDNGMGLARVEWARSLFAATIAGVFSGMRVSLQHITSPYPSVALNETAHNFMESDATDLLLQDLDIVYSPSDLANLLSHDLPYVGGIVPKRTQELELAMWPLEPMRWTEKEISEKPLLSADFGRGFCVIKRHVFDTVAKVSPRFLHEATQTNRVEYVRYKPGGVGSEDFFLCELYRSLGGNPAVDQRIFVRHMGSAEYPLQKFTKSLAVAA